LCALLIAQQDVADTAQRRRWMLVCWAAMALSLLAKGLIGIVLPGGVLFIYALVSGDRGIWRRLHPVTGLLVFLLLALPWFLLVAARNPEQPQFFFIHEHWDRFFLKTHHRDGPWYYFLLLLLPATMPWLATLPASLAAARKRVEGRFQPGRLLLVWTIFILVFFSYSSSKLPGYMLPVFPATALLAGVYLDRASRNAALSAPALLVIVGVAGVVCTRFFPIINLPLLGAAFGVAILCGVAASIAEWRGQRTAMLVLAALGGWMLTQLSMTAYETHGRQQAGRDAALAIRAELKDDTPVYAVGTYEQSMTFYMGHTVIPVAYSGELDFGLQQESWRGVASLDEFYARWLLNAGRGVPQYAIVRDDLYGVMRLRGLPMIERARGEGIVVVASPLK
jgi:4-amino-4-deoxy-L-arabinose transferase-like glycosyltransferase